MKSLKPLILFFCLSLTVVAAAQGFTERYMERVSATQAQQPHWMTPIATVTPRLEQEFRFDVVHQVTDKGNVTNLDNGKGLELIPARRVELLMNLPPYLLHQDSAARDGFGDVSFTAKYRIWARDEEAGNGILTAFLGGSIPTGTYTNGSQSAVVVPTLAGGKGWGRFDVQSTLAGTLPVDSVRTLGRSIQSNTAFQYHVFSRFWPEAEINSTFWKGGSHDREKQTFATPAVIFGRFPITGGKAAREPWRRRRMALVVGAGFQIATTHYHQYNHAVLVTVRMPF